jgi:hypothetical protein
MRARCSIWTTSCLTLSERPEPGGVDRVVVARAAAAGGTDSSEHPTAEGNLCLRAVKNACSERMGGYSIDVRMTCDLAVNALGGALALGGPVSAIVHSDRAGLGVRSH